MSKRITVKQIAKRFSISLQTVNHYTNLGLLIVVAREGNVRLYSESKVRTTLAKISKLATEGYSLGLIRRKLTGV